MIPSNSVQTWEVTPEFPAAGLTLSWQVSAELLQELVGPPYQPTIDPASSLGRLAIFAVSGPASTIDGSQTGPFALAASILRIQTPGETHGVEVEGWSAIPEVIGNPPNPVIQLFKRYGFKVEAGQVELSCSRVESRCSIETNRGRCDFQASFTGDSAAFNLHGALVGTEGDQFSGFSGPETAARWQQGAASVTNQGDTWLTRFTLSGHPLSSVLDTQFVWEFSFWHAP